MSNKFRLAIVVSHPIQHFCPQYVSFSKIEGVEVKLLFASMLGYKKYADKNFGQEIEWNNLRLDEFDHVFMNGDQVLPSSKELDAPALNDHLDSFAPNAIISYGYFQKFQRRVHQWGNENKVPVAYITDAENRQHRSLLKKLAKYFYLRWYFKKINYFLSVGDANEQYYRHYGVPEKKFIRMHYPIDIDLYTKAYAERNLLREQLRKQYDIASNEYIIIVVGKLVEWKNQDHLIDLLLSLEQKNKKASLFVLGSGKTLETLKLKAQSLQVNKVYFTGFVDPIELPNYYAASDLYIHPASIEPHSLAISEAIYMGNPVIVSNRSGSYGVNDDVQVNKNGFTYPFGDIPKLTELVIHLMDDPTQSHTFSKYSHDIAVKFQERAHKYALLELIKKIGI